VLEPSNVKDRIRVRFHIAPFTTIQFSTDGQLKDLGFSSDQIGPRGKQHKFYLKNPTPYFQTVTAENPPSSILAVTAAKISAVPSQAMFSSDTVQFKVNSLLMQNPIKLVKTLNQCLSTLMLQTNVAVSSFFDEEEAVCKFVFPPVQEMTCTLYLPNELALGLGFESTFAITSDSTAKAIKKNWDIGNVRDKALALVYDSGLVVVCADQSSSNCTSGAMDTVLGLLTPTGEGILKLENAQDFQKMVSLPIYSGSGTVIPMSFKLLRIYDNEELMPFEWKTGSFIYGLLRGIVEKV
jgi:hypothetical protein